MLFLLIACVGLLVVPVAAQAQSESAAEMMSMKIWAETMTLRRSMLSAIAPATSESSMMGSEVEA